VGRAPKSIRFEWGKSQIGSEVDGRGYRRVIGLVIVLGESRWAEIRINVGVHADSTY